jgi:hypothetical protein
MNQQMQRADTGYLNLVDKENQTPIKVNRATEKTQKMQASAKQMPNMISSGSGYSRGEFSRDNSPNVKKVFSNRRAENLQSAGNLAQDANSLEESNYHDSPKVVEVRDLLQQPSSLNPFGDYTPSGNKRAFGPKQDQI